MIFKLLDEFFLGLEGKAQKKDSLNGVCEIPLSDDEPVKMKKQRTSKKKKRKRNAK